MRSISLAFVFCAVSVTNLTAQSRPKQLKDQAEHDLYNQALQPSADPARQIQSLDNWTQRYPNSEYKDDRVYMYMQAYSKLKPPEAAKVVQLGGQLISRNLQTVFTGDSSKLVIMNVLFLVAWNAAAIPEPSANELALGQKSAQDLIAFIANNKPENVTEQQWAEARADIEKRAGAALLAMALRPGGFIDIARLPGRRAMASNAAIERCL